LVSEWCGNSSFDQSYAGLEADFADYNVAAYFSEYGCITAGTPRPWTEVASLYSSQMSDVWSGGVAFSYFPATSPQGQFGMVNVSSDGSTITTGQDFANLASQLSAVSPPNSPSQSTAGSTSYPSCPTSNSTFAASTTLPPTPNDAACSCLENSLPCTFKNQYNYTDTVGTLTGSACSLLAQKGGNCNDIASNGTTGTYGVVAMCDPRALHPSLIHFIVSYSGL
jgi:1,3-beta-glucanosyltransferase GAS1